MILLWSLKVVEPFSFQSIYWSKFLDISFSWYCDGLSNVFVMLISGIGICVFLYASNYTQASRLKKAKLLSLLQAFAISMLAIVVTDDMMVLFLAWELTTISSYLLIQFNTADSNANQAAFNAMFISVLGGLAMLAGFILLHQQTSSWSLQNTVHLNSQSSLLIVFVLIMLGVVTKSAQFPFHFWLPRAMKAPTPVSAYLHSATMVNAGIYLLARFHPLFSPLDYWYPVLAFFGMSTMTLAAILSLFQKDLKAILAYTTLFALGSMVYLLASPKWQAIEAFVVFLIFHGIYKASAFMLIGAIDKRYHTRDIDSLRGIAKKWLLSALTAIICFAAMAGLPPFFGFVVKEMIYEAKLASDSVSYILIFLSILNSMFIAATSFKCLFYLFKGNSSIPPDKSNTTGVVYALVLALLVIALSGFGYYLEQIIINAVNSIVDVRATFEPVYSQIATVLSLMTVVGGIIIFIFVKMLKDPLPHCLCHINFNHLFEYLFKKSLYLGRIITHLTQRQPLPQQLVIIFSSLIFWLFIAFCVVFESLNTSIIWSFTIGMSDILSLLLVAIAISFLINCKVIINIIAFALLGIAISAFFVLQGAPDLAMTQLLIEILSTIILAIALRKSTLPMVKTTSKQKIINTTIAIIFGTMITLMLLIVVSVPLNTQLSNFFIDNSHIAAYGRNVVNVILVDFRAFDTFGEAIVILGTALAIYLIITIQPWHKKKKGL
ncbi:hydrogen gas-evolving membrane-bound hydrogenase subunit E [Cysteiniphilum halobium]|uniref:hydrogen gas-evolving membrane-bound hydrogenase subunit E n=1 Tax=Cysteiniphilum halobium TaxID=2219059 RepID=UPI003F858D95